ncbi:MAG: hypothetical protein ACOYK8_07245 [Alphaproteobacteria bacterium]
MATEGHTGGGDFAGGLSVKPAQSFATRLTETFNFSAVTTGLLENIKEAKTVVKSALNPQMKPGRSVTGAI